MNTGPGISEITDEYLDLEVGVGRDQFFRDFLKNFFASGDENEGPDVRSELAGKFQPQSGAGPGDKDAAEVGAGLGVHKWCLLHRLLSALLLFVHFDNAKGKTLNEFSVDEDVYRVNSGAGELKSLESHDEVAADKGNIVGDLNGHSSFDGHFVIDGISIFVDNCNSKFVVAGVFGSEAEAHGERTLWVHNRSGFGCEGVKGSGDNHFPLIFGSEVAK